jgi:hypothetical protein
MIKGAMMGMAIGVALIWKNSGKNSKRGVCCNTKYVHRDKKLFLELRKISLRFKTSPITVSPEFEDLIRKFDKLAEYALFQKDKIQPQVVDIRDALQKLQIQETDLENILHRYILVGQKDSDI